MYSVARSPGVSTKVMFFRIGASKADPSNLVRKLLPNCTRPGANTGHRWKNFKEAEPYGTQACSMYFFDFAMASLQVAATSIEREPKRWWLLICRWGHC